MRNRKPQWIEARAPGARSAAEQRLMHRHVAEMTFTLAGLLVLVGCGSVEKSRGLLGSGAQMVTVNELLASNFTTDSVAGGSPDGVDPAGEPTTREQEYNDWIELYNASEHDARLKGYFITDNPLERPCKQVLPPEAVVPAKGFLRLWADNQPAQGPLHLAFALGDAQAVYLADPSCNLLDGGTDFPSRVGLPCNDPSMQCDYSYARFPDGDGPFAWCETHTPGASNGPACPVPIVAP